VRVAPWIEKLVAARLVYKAVHAFPRYVI